MAQQLRRFVALFPFIVAKATANISIENDFVGIVVDTAHGCSLSNIWAVGDPAKTYENLLSSVS
jgi:hypothetical protein